MSGVVFLAICLEDFPVPYGFGDVSGVVFLLCFSIIFLYPMHLEV